MRRPLVALLLALALPACRDVLEVRDPGAIVEEQLTDSAMASFALNGIKTEYRRGYAWVAAMGAAFTDEAWTGHSWSPWNAYDQRSVTPDNPAHDQFTYPLLQRARGTADVLIPTIERALGTEASASPLLAEAYAYAGFAYVQTADYLCWAPLGAGQQPVSQDSLYREAASRFERAIALATAAGAREGAAEALALARVGLARAALNLGDRTRAIASASLVPREFAAHLRYVERADNDWGMYNFFAWWAGTKFNEVSLVVDPAAFGAPDRRTPVDPAPKRLLDGTREGLLPFQPSSFSEWAPGRTVPFTQTAAIRFASGLEARYVIAEAGGLAPSALRAFVDERRAAGGLSPLPLSADGTTSFRELLAQRARDFFLDGHRTGDLRRYERLYRLDLWPTGPMPGLARRYGSDECWPVSVSELNAPR